MPSATPSSHVVEIVPVLARCTSVLAQSAEEGRRAFVAASIAAVSDAVAVVAVAEARAEDAPPRHLEGGATD